MQTWIGSYSADLWDSPTGEMDANSYALGVSRDGIPVYIIRAPDKSKDKTKTNTPVIGDTITTRDPKDIKGLTLINRISRGTEFWSEFIDDKGVVTKNKVTKQVLTDLATVKDKPIPVKVASIANAKL